MPSNPQPPDEEPVGPDATPPDVAPESMEVEEEVAEEFRSAVEEGAERLHRGWRALVTTGFFGGLEIGLGILAYLAVRAATGSELLAGLAFGIGLVALLLAHSELFTEDFLIPVMAVFARRGTVGNLLRLWGGTLVMNLAGGWVSMLLVTTAFPELGPLLTEIALHFVEAPLDLRAVALSLLGGLVITVLTRMHQGTGSDGVRVFASMAVGFLLAGLGLFHSVLDSFFIFGAIQAEGQVTYLDWLEWLWYVIPLNLLGGLVFVTAMRMVRTSEMSEAPGPSKAASERRRRR